MAKAYDRARTREYTPTCDKKLPEAEQTKFTLSWLSIFDFSSMEEDLLKNPDVPQTFNKMFEMVRRALRGWKNFNHVDGKPALFELGPDGYATRECAGMISPRELAELAHDCNLQESLTSDEVGK